MSKIIGNTTATPNKIDLVLSAESTNAVANKAVTEAINTLIATDVLVLTGHCDCADEDIVSNTAGARIQYTTTLSDSGYNAYNTFYGMGTAKKDIIVRLNLSNTEGTLGSSEMPPIVYMEARVYAGKMSVDMVDGNIVSVYGIQAVGTGYCADPRYSYKVHIECIGENTATITAELYTGNNA